MSPVYQQIAIDIAARIARGDLKENTKLYGRSVMSSEYGVSPETIRRSMNLLKDMNIIEVKQNSGYIVKSAQNANLYVERFGEQNNIRSMKRRLDKLLKEQEETSDNISNLINTLIRTNERFTKSNPFNNHEIDIKKGSSIIGRTIGDLNFWQETTATIIAIRRKDKIILSPGPYAVIEEDDTLIFVGDFTSVQIVSEFIK